MKVDVIRLGCSEDDASTRFIKKKFSKGPRDLVIVEILIKGQHVVKLSCEPLAVIHCIVNQRHRVKPAEAVTENERRRSESF